MKVSYDANKTYYLIQKYEFISRIVRATHDLTDLEHILINPFLMLRNVLFAKQRVDSGGCEMFTNCTNCC